MSRPRLLRKINFDPSVTYFKPQGIPLKDLEVVHLELEEIEAYRLRYIKNLEQQEAATIMHTSQSTYKEYCTQLQKIADALINGKAINIINNSYEEE